MIKAQGAKEVLVISDEKEYNSFPPFPYEKFQYHDLSDIEYDEKSAKNSAFELINRLNGKHELPSINNPLPKPVFIQDKNKMSVEKNQKTQKSLKSIGPLSFQDEMNEE